MLMSNVLFYHSPIFMRISPASSACAIFYIYFVTPPVSSSIQVRLALDHRTMHSEPGHRSVQRLVIALCRWHCPTQMPCLWSVTTTFLAVSNTGMTSMTSSSSIEVTPLGAARLTHQSIARPRRSPTRRYHLHRMQTSEGGIQVGEDGVRCRFGDNSTAG
jgi:hypothetical protein